MEPRFRKAELTERTYEFIRLKGHTILVTILTAFNLLVLLPLGFFTWFSSLLGSYAFSWLYEIPWPAFITLWVLPYFTWTYSTITYPIKKGYKVILDWSRTKKGRILSILFNLSSFIMMSWAGAARYSTEKYVPYLSSIHVEESRKGFFLVDDLNSLILLIYFMPVIVAALLGFSIVRHFQINKDILHDQFYTWEMPFLTRFTHTAEMDMCDVIVGYDMHSKKPLVIKEDQRFLHEGSFGATGSGKTSTAILLRIAQDLIKIATGRRKMGLIFLEPKGDGVDDVLMLAKKLGIPDEKIMVIDPTKAFSTKYNPFAGPLEAAAASFQGTLNALTGDQDEFFKGQQNEAAQTYTLLAKIRYGNLTNITHIQRMFTDPRYLADVVEEVKNQLTSKLEKDDITEDVRKLLESWENIVRYFEDEVLDFKIYRVKDDVMIQTYPPGTRYEGRQVVENKKDKFVTGAKKYLNEIALNSMLTNLFVSEEGDMVFDADEFLANGGVLLVNTALAELEELSLMFGQFFIRQLQSAVFRRPKEGRIPIFLYVDEFPLYANEAFERFLTLGRSYKVGTLIAMQSLGQLDNIVKGFKETVLSNASSKTVFGRGTVTDNEYFSKEFGEELVVEESVNESASPMTTDSKSWGFRMNTQKKFMPRFSPTQIRELPFKQMVVQVVDENNSISVSTKAVGRFVHEAQFLKPYLRVKKEEIKSTDEKDFIIETMVSQEIITNLSTSDNPPPFDDGVNEPVAEIEQVELQLDLESDQIARRAEVVPIHAKQKKKKESKPSGLFQSEIDFSIDADVEPIEPSKPVLINPVPNASVPSDEINRQVEELLSGFVEMPIAEVESSTNDELPIWQVDEAPPESESEIEYINFEQLFNPQESEVQSTSASNFNDEDAIRKSELQALEQSISDRVNELSAAPPEELESVPPVSNAPFVIKESITDDF
ncbi:TraM recognition domain-containing protein (plasmid) [Sporosarcina psychrophila]|uniref:type IV secretory system conjugative DNA transfer family protein n=1 Tax=Sporosarcina psychrophila TaxID=1476 RepID=UPI0030D2562C